MIKSSSHKGFIQYTCILCISLSYACLYSQGNGQEDSVQLEADKFQEHFYEALKQQGIGNYDLAVREWKKCLEVNPLGVIHYQLGKSYFEQNLYDQATDHLEKAASMEPSNKWYSKSLLDMYLIQNDYEKAEVLCRNHLNKHPRWSYLLALNYSENKQYDKALNLLQQVEKERGRSATQDSIEDVVLRLKDGKANHKPKEALSKTEKVASSAFEIMQDLFESGNYEQLKKVAQEALADFPTEPKAYYYLGISEKSLGQFKEAQSWLEMSLDYLVDNSELEALIYKELIGICEKELLPECAERYRKRLLELKK